MFATSCQTREEMKPTRTREEDILAVLVLLLLLLLLFLLLIEFASVARISACLTEIDEGVCQMC